MPFEKKTILLIVFTHRILFKNDEIETTTSHKMEPNNGILIHKNECFRN